MRLRSDIETHFVGGDCHAFDVFDFNGFIYRVRESACNGGIDGKIYLFAEFIRFVEHFLAVFDFLVVDERRSYLTAFCLYKGISHTAANDERIAFIQKIVDDLEFVCNFRSAQNGYERSSGILYGATEEFEFLFNEETADSHGSVSVLNDTCGRSVSTVSRSESVVDVYVAEFRELFAELLAVLFLTCVKTSVFQQNGFAVFKRSHFLLSVLAHKVGGKSDFAGEDFV